MKVALLLNTNALGGAERSVIEQLNLVQEKISLNTFIPSLSGNNEKMVKFIEEKLVNSALNFYRIPTAFYKINKKSKTLELIKGAVSLFNSPVYFRDLKKLKETDVLYCNGNKIAIWTLVWSTVFKFNGKIIWHFRDYPSKNIFFRLFINRMAKKYSANLNFVANSHSVAEALRSLDLENVSVLYNIAGKDLSANTIKRPIKKIGVVSMMANWKGIHQVVIMANLYEKELKSLGIESLTVYTGQIYQTSGDHLSYEKELLDLVSKFPSSLIHIQYNQNPKEIFKKLDLLIHPSIEAEPFGRVILEAFRSRVPVISTSIGGASELIDGDKNGLTFFKYDYTGLFNQVKKLTTQDSLREVLIENAYRKSFEIEAAVKSNLQELLGVA